MVSMGKRSVSNGSAIVDKLQFSELGMEDFVCLFVKMKSNGIEDFDFWGCLFIGISQESF